MVSLIAQSPCHGLFPVDAGAIEIREVMHDRIQSLAPFKGQSRVVSEKLKAQTGHVLPKPNRSKGSGSRIVSTGPGQYLVLGQEVDGLDEIAAVTDQTDAWAVIQLSGTGVEDVLARLVPLDLRPKHFKVGHTARTLLGHMSCSITRTAADTFEVMVMRSMASTLVHELSRAASGVAARG